MKYLIAVVLCSWFFLGVLGKEHIEVAESDNPAAECHPKLHNLGPMKAGEEHKVAEKCITARCDEDGSVHYFDCEEVESEAPPTCWNETPGDPSRPYPDCCHALVCP